MVGQESLQKLASGGGLPDTRMGERWIVFIHLGWVGDDHVRGILLIDLVHPLAVPDVG